MSSGGLILTNGFLERHAVIVRPAKRLCMNTIYSATDAAIQEGCKLGDEFRKYAAAKILTCIFRIAEEATCGEEAK